MKKVYLITFVLLGITLSFQLIHVYIANKVSEESVELAKSQSLISQYEEENDLLRSKILQNSTFEMIASRAALLGFSDPQESISLYDPLELAVSHEQQ